MWGPDDIYTLQAASVGVIQFSSKGGICFATLRTRCSAAVAAGVWILLGGPQVDKESPIPIPRVRGERGPWTSCVQRRGVKSFPCIYRTVYPRNAKPLAFT